VVRRHGVIPCGHETGVRPLSKGSAILFRGCGVGLYESGWHSVTELTLALPHSVVQWRGWPHREGWRNNAGI
jgi:hypothetical protein